MISFILNMVYQKVTDLSFDEAKQHTKIITGIINEFLDSVEQIFPGIGYGDMAVSNQEREDSGGSHPAGQATRHHEQGWRSYPACARRDQAR